MDRISDQMINTVCSMPKDIKYFIPPDIWPTIYLRPDVQYIRPDRLPVNRYTAKNVASIRNLAGYLTRYPVRYQIQNTGKKSAGRLHVRNPSYHGILDGNSVHVAHV